MRFPRRERALRSRVPLSCLQTTPAAPGTCEDDLVEHNGGSSGGQYVYTVHVVDVVTAWRGKRACVSKHPARVISQLECLGRALPYAPRVLGTDVRGLVGYRRYDTVVQCALLNCIYALDDLHVNLWLPCRKLIGRVRDEEHGTWRKRYDAVRTQLERVVDRPEHDVPAAVKARLTGWRARVTGWVAGGEGAPAGAAAAHAQPRNGVWR